MSPLTFLTLLLLLHNSSLEGQLLHHESSRLHTELIDGTSARQQKLNNNVVIQTERTQSISNEASTEIPQHRVGDIHGKHLEIGDAVINRPISRGQMGAFNMKSYQLFSKAAGSLHPGYQGRMLHGNSPILTEPVSQASMLQNQNAGRPNFTLVGDSVSVNNVNDKKKTEESSVFTVENSASVKPVQTKIDIKNLPLPSNRNFHHGTTNLENHVLATFGGMEERNRGGKLEAKLPMSFSLTGKTVSGQRPKNAGKEAQDYLVIHTENGVSVNPIPNRIMNVEATSNVGERRLHAFVQPSYVNNGNGTGAQKMEWKMEKNVRTRPFFLTGKGVSAELKQAPKNGKAFQNSLKIQTDNDSVLWKGDPIRVMETTPLSHFGPQEWENESRPGRETRFQLSRNKDVKERHFGGKSIRDTGGSFFTVGKGVNIQRTEGQDARRFQELVMKTGNGVSVKHTPNSFTNMAASTANIGGTHQSIGFKPIQNYGNAFSQPKVNKGRIQGESERKMGNSGLVSSASAGKGINAQEANGNFKDGLRIMTGNSVSIRPSPNKVFKETQFQNKKLYPGGANFGQWGQGHMNGKGVGEKMRQNEDASFSLTGEGVKVMDLSHKGSSFQHPWVGGSMAPLQADTHGPMGSYQDTKEPIITSRHLQEVKIGEPLQILGQNKPNLKEDLNHQIHFVKTDNTEITLKGNTPYVPQGLQPTSFRNYGHAKGGIHIRENVFLKEPPSFQGRKFLHQMESGPSSDFAFKGIKQTQPNFKGKTQSLGLSSQTILLDKPDQVPQLAAPLPLSLSPASPLEKIALEEHQRYRKMHHSRPMILNKDLMLQARRFAKKLLQEGKLSHDSDVDLKERNEGENLGMVCSASYIPSARKVKRIVQKWYEEGCNYNFQQPHLSDETAHFTQLVWAASRELGIGVAEGDWKGKHCLFVVARYRPMGNIPVSRLFQDNVKPKISSYPRKCVNITMI